MAPEDSVEALRQRIEELEAEVKICKAKHMFLKGVSPEIRVPVSSANGIAKLLLDTKLDGRQKEYAEWIHEFTQIALDVFDQVLTVQLLPEVPRHHVELSQRVAGGELSANAAAIEAGFCKGHISVPADDASKAIAMLLLHYSWKELQEVGNAVDA